MKRCRLPLRLHAKRATFLTDQKRIVAEMRTAGPSNANIRPLNSVKQWNMFTSSAVVFRTRQAVSDLAETIGDIGPSALERISSSDTSVRAFRPFLANGRWRFRLPEQQSAYSDILLAAALPEEDFSAFILATCALLLDRLLEGEGHDNLYWNWDAFQDHYRLADAPTRAALMNGFRIAEAREFIAIRNGPTDHDCMTNSLDSVMRDVQDDPKLLGVLREEISEVEAGKVWAAGAEQASPAFLKVCRYLYERPMSMNPEPAELVPTIPFAPILPRQQ